MKTPTSTLLTKSQSFFSDSLKVAAVITLALNLLPAVSLANPACAEIFESRYEGLLLNPAARAAMLFKLREVLPEGRHQVLTKLGEKATLSISYSPIGEAQVSLGTHSLVTTLSSLIPVKSPNGNVYQTEARMQLLGGDRLVLTNSQTSGNYLSLDGLKTRDVGVQFEFSKDGGGLIQVTETTTIRSQYRPTNETYTIRQAYRLVQPGSI